MKVMIAQTFSQALEKLDPVLQERAWGTILMLFNQGPEATGLNYEALKGKAKGWFSVRVNNGVRIILAPSEKGFLIAHVGQHDPAYKWADDHILSSLGTNRVLQITEIQERVVSKEIIQPTLVKLPPLMEFSDEALLRAGLPPERFDWARDASEDALLDEDSGLSPRVQENLLEIITGGRDARYEVKAIYPSHELTRGQFERFSEPGAWREWLVFLHESQRALAYETYPGPVRFHGSAGTGKTITLLHRAKHLLERHEGHHVLLTTATISIPEMLEEQLSQLIPAEHSHRARIDLSLLPDIASPFYQRAKGHPFRYDPGSLDRIFSHAYEHHAPLSWSMEVLKAEFDMVIDPMGVRSEQEYLDLPRIGRGTRLGRLARAKIWPVFETVFEEIGHEHLSTYDDLYLVATRWLQEHPEHRRYDHVLVDESQDLSHTALLFIRTLVTPGDDDITLVGDVGQRTMGHKTSWRGAGIELEGRSYQLDVNFRTTEKVRIASESLLPLHLEGPDGEIDARASVSLELGEPLTLIEADSPEEETVALAEWLDGLITIDGLSPNRVALTYFSSGTDASMNADSLDGGRKIALDALELLSLHEKTADREGVWVRPVRAIKGLEFDVVAILDCSEGSVPREHLLETIADRGDHQNAREREARFLYIAATRAKYLLWISWSSRPSKFLAPITRMVPIKSAGECRSHNL